MEIADEIKQRPDVGARRLVAEYRERLYQVAYRLCLNAADADDLVFRTMQRAMERIGSYRPTGSFYQWLYAIMVNFRRMDLRRKAANMLDFTDELPETASDTPAPAETLAAAEDASAVRAAAGYLPRGRGVPLLRGHERPRDRPTTWSAGRERQKPPQPREAAPARASRGND